MKLMPALPESILHGSRLIMMLLKADKMSKN